jgi:hypothetical protein
LHEQWAAAKAAPRASPALWAHLNGTLLPNPPPPQHREAVHRYARICYAVGARADAPSVVDQRASLVPLQAVGWKAVVVENRSASPGATCGLGPPD